MSRLPVTDLTTVSLLLVSVCKCKIPATYFRRKILCKAKKLQRIAISGCPLKIKRNGGKPFHCTVRGYVAVPTFAQSNRKAAGKH